MVFCIKKERERSEKEKEKKKETEKKNWGFIEIVMKEENKKKLFLDLTF